MAAPSATTAFQRAYYATGTVVLVTAVLYWGKVVLIPLALAVLLAFVLTPLVLRLERHGLRRTTSIVIAALVAFSSIGGILYLTGVEITAFAQALRDDNRYEVNINKKLAPLYGFLDQLEGLEKFGQKVERPSATTQLDKDGKPLQPTPVVVQSNRSILSWIPALAGSVVETAAQVLLVAVLTVFILFQRENLRDRLIRLIGRRYLTSTTKAMGDAAERVSRYLVLQLGTNTAMGLCVGTGLFLIGVPYALLWGVLALVLRFIPYAGIWLAAALPLLVSIAVSPDWLQPLLVLALFVVLEFVTANIVEPLLFGHGTGVGPLALLVAAVFWAWLWGPIGLLLSAPLTVIVIVVGKHVPGLKFLDVLLSDEPALGPAARYYQRLLAGDRDEAALLVEKHMESHPPEAVYDEVLLPALVRARHDRSLNEITAEEQEFIERTTRELLDEVLAHIGPVHPEAVGAAPQNVNGRADSPQLEIHVAGCPARGTADELALRMLEQVLQPLGSTVEIMPPRVLLGEAKGAEPPAEPEVLVIADLPPGGLTEARTLCRRLRGKYAKARIYVGRWGEHDDEEGARQYLKAAGADAVAVSLLETRRQLLEAAEARHNEPVAASAP
jgi:predicted PurR-regulated permease PerM